MSNTVKPLNVKLRQELKNDFKSITKNRGTTMQAVTAAFIESYVDTPDKFRLKVEVVES